MKFDTPATTNPIDQLKVIGQPADRIDGPLKTTGTAPYAYERHDVAPNPAYGYVVGAAIAKGRIAVDRPRAPPRPRPACSPSSRRENAGKLGKGKLQHRQAARRPRDRALPPGDRARRRRDLRAGARRRAAGPRRLCTRPRARSTSRRRRTPAKPAQLTRRPGRHRRRRLRRRVRRGAGPARRDLHHARPGARDDGAARLDRRLGRRQADGLDLEPDDRLERGRPGQDARHPQGERPPDLALHRRRLRRQAVPARRRAARRARRARGRTAGEGGAARGR